MFDREAFQADAVDLGRKHFSGEAPPHTAETIAQIQAKMNAGQDLTDEECEQYFNYILDGISAAMASAAA